MVEAKYMHSSNTLGNCKININQMLLPKIKHFMAVYKDVSRIMSNIYDEIFFKNKMIFCFKPLTNFCLKCS